ncbi:MAG: TRAP transporter large permease subunit [Proteobacteria bacterium]|nr:TRAP transporter large permease subunit [Pseudomonadota bacterium]
MIAILVIGLFLFFILNIPISFSMILTSVMYLFLKGDIPLIVTAQRVAVGTDKYLLLCIPFFFLAGELMNAGGIMERLVRFSKSLVGHIPGGLGHVNVVSSMLFSGISGSAVSDASGLGILEIELMRRSGYDDRFSGAITAASATIGPVIPPSIPFVIYGGITGVSVGKLFLGGIIPGLLMGLFLMVFVYRIAIKRGYERSERVPFTGVLRELYHSILVLILPLIILGGILSGAFTPTEAAVVAAVYAFFVGTTVLREIQLNQVFRLMIRVGVNSAKLLFIIASASLFGWILAREGVPLLLAKTFLSISHKPYVVLFLVNILLLGLGCFMEPITVMIILVPILTPLIETLGIDLVHFGVIMTLNLMIGLITPPVGMVMFVVMNIANLSVAELTKGLLPFFTALLIVLFLITYIPWLVLWIPGMF